MPLLKNVLLVMHQISSPKPKTKFIKQSIILSSLFNKMHIRQFLYQAFNDIIVTTLICLLKSKHLKGSCNKISFMTNEFKHTLHNQHNSLSKI